MINRQVMTNGAPKTSTPKTTASGEPSQWLTAQCKEIVGKIVQANQKYQVSFTDIHATLVRKHPGQKGMIDAIVQAAEIVSFEEEPEALKN